jgi:hypothetical protein
LRSTPIGSTVHFPGFESNEHEWHRSVHGVSQQTPSTQKPVVQSLPLAQRVTFETCGIAGSDGAGCCVKPPSPLVASAAPESIGVDVSEAPVSSAPASGVPESTVPASNIDVHLPLATSQLPVVQSAAVVQVVLHVNASAQV